MLGKTSTVAQPLTEIEKFARHFRESRISADIRFHVLLKGCALLRNLRYILPRTTPDRGFCESVCICKFRKRFPNLQPQKEFLTIFVITVTQKRIYGEYRFHSPNREI